ncbi:glutamate receptor-interacting protein 2-like isoform X2 [Daphnia pulex]|uniref:glutamate receptor-interacting protein 2-like isoform X2 n=1 Tax=Daphnia pulex TaxID=6669 RepID=UPI001EE05FC1|nr:glutamate receptor-interacting protein 2-like isoform X2 [Daphnia pulex]
MLTSLKNSLSSYFSINKPPRPPKRSPSSGDKGGGSGRSRSSVAGVSRNGGGGGGGGGGSGSDDEISSIHRILQQPDVDYELLPSSSNNRSSYAAGSNINSQRQPTISIRTKEIRLVRDAGSAGSGSGGDGGYGITLRCSSSSSSASNGGGGDSNGKSGRSFIITFVKPNSPADRDGTVQIGDRVLSVNGRELAGCSLIQAQKWIRETDKLSAVIEYDVALVDRSQYAHSPLLVEVEKSPGSLLGINLVAENTTPKTNNQRGVVIESITSASIAERCGALHPGDQILAVGDVRLDGPSGVDVQEVARLLRSNYSGDVVKLIVAPSGMLGQRRNGEHGSRRGLLPPPSPRPSLNGTMRSRLSSRTKSRSGIQRMENCSTRLETASVASSGQSGSSKGSCSMSSPSTSHGRVMLSHPEWVTVTLQIDCRGSYGLALGRAPDHEAPVVINVESNSPCDRAGCIQPGDRILRINQQSTAGMNLDEVVELMRDSKPRMTLDVEFDVADSVVPATGVYWLKLIKPTGSSSTFGITLQDDAKVQRTSDGSLAVSAVLPGSVAHRTGSVQAGDRLLAINNSRVEILTIDEALSVLQSEQIIRLKLHKSQSADELPQQAPVVYTVELVRHGGPLGITISGTESPDDPITISGLTEGGLAERTGALHAGDRLLAINGRSLQGKLLSEAIEILQNSGDIVTLKIGKSNAKVLNTGELQREDYLPLKLPPLPSIDSAVESWVSGASNRNNNNNNDSTPIYTAESATVRRRQNNNREQCWDMLSSPSVDSGQFEVQCNVIVNGPVPSSSSPANSAAGTSPGQQQQDGCEVETAEPVIRMSDLALVQRCSTLPRNYRKLTHPQRPDTDNCSNTSRASPIYCLAPAFPGSQLPSNLEIHQVTLHKDSVYEDFGFSVSDGLYERGIYINRIRKGGPADLSGLLQAFDRILQVNDTRTYDFDCCLTVPLIAAAGDTILLVVGRNPLSVHLDLKENAVSGLNWDEDEDGMIPADADDMATSSAFVGVRTITTTL